MRFITENDIIAAARLAPLHLQSLAFPLMKALKINQVNRLFDEHKAEQGLQFIDGLLKNLNITIDCNEKELARIPKSGAFLAVANHPYGGLDGLILIKLLATARPELKVLANHLLARIGNLSDFFIEVNPFETTVPDRQNILGMRHALDCLQQGMPLAMFPAAQVSAMHAPGKTVEDREWHIAAGKLVQKAKVPVLPVYFYGQNSLSFQLLGLLHPALRTAMVPAELVNKQGITVKVRIGKPIQPDELANFKDSNQLVRYLRARTYALGSGARVDSFFKSPFKVRKLVAPIALETDPELIAAEIETLRKEKLLFSQGNFEVFCAKAHLLPHTLQELGRLREITFRDTGEGTNRKRDNDEYDLYYHHLFVWDKVNSKLAGAYRIGKGKEILRMYGKRGFYLHSLFKMRNEMLPVLEQSLELGRSFVCPEYQKKMLPLFLLWRGILTVLRKEPGYRYLIGPVSVSSRFSRLSVSLLIAFIKRYHYDKKLAQYVTPRRKFKVKSMAKLSELLIVHDEASVDYLENLITDVEPSQMRMPVLLKKYIRQNGKILGFNLDPRFNEALDGFLLLDTHDLPAETLQMLQKE